MDNEYNIFYKLVNKYKHIPKNSCYHKYNFIIEVINNVNIQLHIDYVLQDKDKSCSKVPLIQLKASKKFDINGIVFLINNNFDSDIKNIIFYTKDNISTIYNGIIVNMNTYTVICKPCKKFIFSKLSGLSKYNDEDIIYEYDLYKLYDGTMINLYYDDEWKLSTSSSIDINNTLLDYVNKLSYKNAFDNEISCSIFNVKHTYCFFLINSNYHISNECNKLRFVYSTDKEIDLSYITIKKLNSITDKSVYGMILYSKRGLEHRIITSDYFQTIKKLVYQPLNTNTIMMAPDLKFITVRAILKYKISKKDVYNTYTFLIKYYKYIIYEIYNIVSLYIHNYPNFSNVNQKYKAFLYRINNDIKNTKTLNNIFYNTTNCSDIVKDNIFFLILQDYVTQQKYITDIYNILF